MRFLLDSHLPPALAVALRNLGHECEEARKLVAPDAADTEIAAVANQLGTVVLSKDADFVDLKLRKVLQTPLIRIRLPNMSAKDTVAAIIPQLPRLIMALEAGETLLEVR